MQWIPHHSPHAFQHIECSERKNEPLTVCGNKTERKNILLLRNRRGETSECTGGATAMTKEKKKLVVAYQHSPAPNKGYILIYNCVRLCARPRVCIREGRSEWNLSTGTFRYIETHSWWVLVCGWYPFWCVLPWLAFSAAARCVIVVPGVILTKTAHETRRGEKKISIYI